MPCANVNPYSRTRCPNTGTRACSACRLVLYCTPDCQKTHWRQHKEDCKHEMNSKDWAPDWIKEKRYPVFSPDETQSLPSLDLSTGIAPVGLGQSLWGNIPAMDLFNLRNNEGLAYQKDLSILFAASGDMRNVLLTINGIPPDYQGNLSVSINDINPLVASRNLLILVTLMGVRDESLAADIALHLWYSAFIPVEYDARIRLATLTTLNTMESTPKGTFMDWSYDNGVQIIAHLSETASAYYASYIQEDQIDANTASDNRLHVLFSPHRIDYYHRCQCKLSPAHRTAMKRYRDWGLVHPFGAANIHFNVPNKTLFNTKGEWLQDDMSCPIDGWDLREVIATGKTHGVTPEDIFGCLYFYLHDQLLILKRKLETLKVTFWFTDVDCHDLAKTSKSPFQDLQFLSPTMRSKVPAHFDRVDVSNTGDDAYIGFAQTLMDWCPRLNKSNPFSTLLSYSMNWTYDGGKGNPDQDQKEMARIIKRFQQENNVIRLNLASSSPAAMYDNSGAYDEYLRARYVPETVNRLGVQMKLTHSIVPPVSKIAP
ncbi:hypothetical protein M408DRAFT_72721 [Serendipita vermifera MAFF 305830]|uniref:MYND-type domain-containing protein n=1 Tax=Serendipita vermifera MAFF 305830 TaxID=933852 RepID=A0A0C2WJF1_SERVB|nr:hypothetical protein M408DRAFT_72721 [Serendipita vermifera MAFF 305830]